MLRSTPVLEGPPVAEIKLDIVRNRCVLVGIAEGVG